ncbi:MAG TPA: amino acid permease [Longimicrobiales bacterium]|nr:amino acid permease [Longimicrobiales bacterium]
MAVSPPSVAPAALRRSIGTLQATSLVVGIVIGASIFVQPSEITREVPSIPWIFAAWLASGALTLGGALICAELSSAYPRAGGVYSFLRETLSPATGFLWGWAAFWSAQTGILAVIALVFARYAAVLLPVGDAAIPLLAVGAIATAAAINYVGVQYGGRVQAAFTVAKVAAIALLIVAAFVLGGRVPAHFVGPAAPPPVSGTGFARALAAGLITFGGWHMITYAAEETVDPRRTIPRALFVGILVVTACYMALNAAYLYVLPLDTVARSTRVAADAADAVVGSGGGALLAGLVVFSTFGGLNGLTLAGSRVYRAMAEDGLLFRWAGAIHPRFRTPHRAIVLQATWAAVLVVTGTFRGLVGRVVFTEWIFFALMAAGMWAARRRSDYAPAYRVPGGFLVPGLFIAGTAAVLGTQVVSRPAESAAGVAFVAAGLPVYWLWSRANARKGEVSRADPGRA